MSTSILLNAEGRRIENRYPAVDSETPILHGSCVQVPLERLQEAVGAGAELALLLPNTAAIAALPPLPAAVTSVHLQFPGFADGRAYSQATLLRRSGFAGQIRAMGAAVVVDQLRMMRRCGITEFALHHPEERAAAETLLQQAEVQFYQPDSTSLGFVLGSSRNP